MATEIAQSGEEVNEIEFTVRRKREKRKPKKGRNRVDSSVGSSTKGRKRKRSRPSSCEKSPVEPKKKRTRTKSIYDNYCHQCHENGARPVVRCVKCKRKKFCYKCIDKWYNNMSEEDLTEACPVCRGTCTCGKCLHVLSHKEMRRHSCTDHEKVQYSKYILKYVLPLVKCLNDMQLMEKEIEAKVQGLSIAGIKLQHSRCRLDECLQCGNCGNAPFDFYRSCPKCHYTLCLICCQELRNGRLNHLPLERNTDSQDTVIKTSEWEYKEDGFIPCPPKNMSGCGNGILELKHTMAVDWLPNLLDKVQELSKKLKIDNIPPKPSERRVYEGEIRDKKLMKAASRENSENNYLYYSSAKDNQGCQMQHFQWHWASGEPVIVSDILETGCGLSWEPMVMRRAIRMKIPDGIAIDCLNEDKVNINLYNFFKGYSEGVDPSVGWPLLKLQDWPPLDLCKEQLPRHLVEFISCLPFKEYTHPRDGYLNINSGDVSDPFIIPKMHVAYGIAEELGIGDSVTRLHCKMSDTVNLLVHSESVTLSSIHYFKIHRLLKDKLGALDQREFLGKGQQIVKGAQNGVGATEGGALWDIFRRQDIDKLEKYIRTHISKLQHVRSHPLKKGIHPVYEKIFYLTTEHKRRLKDEFGIEPWTFLQKQGDAVLVPAGCPYQIRNLKSCMNVELDFISPESLGACCLMQDKFRTLPESHCAKERNLKLEKMMLLTLDKAVKDLAELAACDDNEKEPLVEKDEKFQEASGSGTCKVDLSSIPESNLLRNSTTYDVPPSFNGDPMVKDVDGVVKQYPDADCIFDGLDLGEEEVELLQTVNNLHPQTFADIDFPSTETWQYSLKLLSGVMKTYRSTSMPELEKDGVAELHGKFNVLQKVGFNLSWAHERLKMVERLNFGNHPLLQELATLDKTLTQVKETLAQRKNEYRQASTALIEARRECTRVRLAMAKKAADAAKEFGVDYESILMVAACYDNEREHLGEKDKEFQEATGSGTFNMELSSIPESNLLRYSTTYKLPPSFNGNSENKDVEGVVKQYPDAGCRFDNHDLGKEEVELLQTVNNLHPETFADIDFPSKKTLQNFLNHLSRVMKTFCSISMSKLAKHGVDELHGELHVLEKVGFKLSWAHERLKMAERLNFGNLPLLQELATLHKTLTELKGMSATRENEYQQASTALTEARSECERATVARAEKAADAAKEFGVEYVFVLKGDLGFG